MAPDWFIALEGAEALRVPFREWVGLPAWDEVPLCVQAWTFARAHCKYWGAKFKADIEKDKAGA